MWSLRVTGKEGSPGTFQNWLTASFGSQERPRQAEQYAGSGAGARASRLSTPALA